MDQLPTIPTPARELWREFRVQVVPGLVFVTALVVAVVMWRTSVVPATLVGEVEPRQALVTSPQAGALTHLTVDRLQRVSAGDPVAQVITTDPKIIEASLAVIRAEVELLQAGLTPVLDQQRNAMDLQRLKLELLQQRVSLATALAKLPAAVSEFRRVEQLFRDKLVPQDQFDIAKSAMEALQAEITERRTLVEQMSPQMSAFEMKESPDHPRDPLQSAIAVEEKKLKLTEAQLNPITLHAPMGGVVSIVHRIAGENIAAGEPILTISAVHSERVVGFLPQPLTLKPTVGMPVEIRSRSLERRSVLSQIAQIGVQFEPVTPTLLRPGVTVERGLQIFVNLPADANFLPGELVDVIIRPQKAVAAQP